MLGLLVFMIASFVILKYFGYRRAFILWFVPTRRRLIEFFFGLLGVMIIRLATVGAETLLFSIKWQRLVPEFRDILFSFGWHLRSALTEELIFRGAILYLIFSRFGLRTSVLLSSFAFGVYHWFSYGMIGGRWIPMLFVLIISLAVGAVWSMAFLKTRSIFLALGFHVAWNFTGTLFHDLNPYGQLLAAETSRSNIEGWGGTIASLSLTLIPAFLMWELIKWYSARTSSLN